MFVNWTDIVVLVSKLTFNRIFNLLKIANSYIWSRLSKKPVISGLPVSIAIEPTTACNLRCPECPSGLRSFTRPTGNIRQRTFKKVIDELSVRTCYLTFYFQGEPYLHPDFFDMVKYAARRNLYTATSTNGHFLDESGARRTILSGLSRIIISIDGIDQSTYESYRVNGSLEKVLAGTENLVFWKKKLKSVTPAIIWQFLVVRPNEDQIQEVKTLAKVYGVDKVAFKTAQIYDYKEGNDLIPSRQKYSRYVLQQDGTYRVKGQQLDHCWKMWSSCVITWDGKIVPCCFDKDAAHQLGDLQHQSFKEIWHSKPYQNFRSAVIKARSEIEMCQNCTVGTRVWA